MSFLGLCISCLLSFLLYAVFSLLFFGSSTHPVSRVSYCVLVCWFCFILIGTLWLCCALSLPDPFCCHFYLAYSAWLCFPSCWCTNASVYHYWLPMQSNCCCYGRSILCSAYTNTSFSPLSVLWCSSMFLVLVFLLSLLQWGFSLHHEFFDLFLLFLNQW